MGVKPIHLTKTYKNKERKANIPTNGSTGQREKAPAEPVCLITLVAERK